MSGWEYLAALFCNEDEWHYLSDSSLFTAKWFWNLSFNEYQKSIHHYAEC